MENAKAAFLEAARAVPGPISQALSRAVINPDLLSAVERSSTRATGSERKRTTLSAPWRPPGTLIKEIVRRIGGSRKLVRAVFRNGEDEVSRSRTSRLEPWLRQPEEMWKAGCRNASRTLAPPAGRGLRLLPADCH